MSYCKGGKGRGKERRGQGRNGNEWGKEGRERKGKDGEGRGEGVRDRREGFTAVAVELGCQEGGLFKSTPFGPSLFACEKRLYSVHSGQVFVNIVAIE